jgi:hypothetical protein
MFLFADDTAFHVFGDSHQQMIDKLNACMESVRNYFRVNKLTLNTDKTMWMNFSDSSRNPTAKVMFGDRIIQETNKFKYLGFVLDSKLLWKEHVEVIIAKVKSRLYCLRRSKYSMSTEGRLMLFNALIKPYFTYGIEMWYAAGKTARDTLDILQRHCIRIILNDTSFIPTLSNARIYIVSDVLPLSLTFQLHLAQMMYKIINLGACRPLGRTLSLHYLDSTSRNSALRNIDVFKIPFSRLESTRSRLTFYGCLLWNLIDSNLRNADSIVHFTQLYENLLRDWMASNPGDFGRSKFYDFI